MKSILWGWTMLPLVLLVWSVAVFASARRLTLLGPNLVLATLTALALAAIAFIVGYSEWSPRAGETLGWFFIPILFHSIALVPSALLLFFAARKRGEPTLVPKLVVFVLFAAVALLWR